MTTPTLYGMARMGNFTYLRLEKYREDFFKAQKRAFEWAKERGAEGFQPGFYGELYGLVYKTRERRTGWREIKSRRGHVFYVPDNKNKMDKTIITKIAALVPSVSEVAKDLKIPEVITWENKVGKCSGSSVLGGMWPVQICWVHEQGEIFIVFPDAAEARRACIKENGLRTRVTNIPSGWKPPHELKMLVEQEYELEWAKERVKWEVHNGRPPEAKKAAPPTDGPTELQGYHV